MSSRPWREKPKSNASSPGPLVPINVVSATSQRLVVTAVFFLLQGFKLASRRSVFNFLFFSALDAALTYSLPILAIPRLNFRSKVIFIQTTVLLLLNYTLFVSSAWVYALLWLMAGPLFAIFGPSRGGSGRDLGLISGKYVVDILPEASARLDTIAPLCIHPQRSDPVYLRLSLENSWPSGVQLGRATLGNNETYDRFAFGKREIAKMPAERKESSPHIYLPVTKPGAYYLDAIMDDHTGLRVKVQRDRIVIPPCPSVDLTLLGDSRICQSDKFVAQAKLNGVGPFNVFVDGQWKSVGEKLPDDGVSTEFLTVAKEKDSNSVEITKIKDGTGVTVNVDKKVFVRRIEPPVATIPGTQQLALVDNAGSGVASVDAMIHVAGNPEDAPFTFELRKPQSESESSDAETGDNGLMELKVGGPGLHHFKVSEVGKYVLEGVKGSRCKGKAAGEFEVFVPSQVSLDAEFNVVEDKCAGPTGVDAILRLMGTAPFKVGYRTLKGTRVVSQKVAEIKGSKAVIRFQPEDVGEYRYEIVSVEDKYRHLQLPQGPDSGYATTQKITELPGARFLSISSTKLCGTSQLAVDVGVRGRGPFTLKYTIDDEQEFSITTAETTGEDKLQLNLDLPAGTHYVKLLSLTDRNQCVTSLPGTRTPDIVVQPHLPSIAWAQPEKTIKSADPVDLYLDLSAESLSYPATIAYEHMQVDGRGRKKKHELVLNSPHDRVHATSPGMYRLLSLSDGICGGTADTESEINISLYERPRVEVVPETLPDGICQVAGSTTGSDKHAVVLQAVGEAPFTIVHETVDSLGRSNTQTHKLKTHELKVDLNNEHAGVYTHYLWVMDARYPDFQRSHSTIFKHEVWPRSEALFFGRGGQKLQVCENEPIKPSVPIALKGHAPFELTLKVGTETKVITVADAARFDLRKELGSLKSQGSGKVKILSVVDSKGCRSLPPPTGKDEIDLKVLPKPVVPPAKKLDYCVGDKISFSVTAADKKRDALLPPNNKFRVEYLWGNKRQHTDIQGVNGNQFEKYAHKPGNLSLVSVKDSNGCGTVFTKPQVMAHVHALPKSTITEEPHFSIYKGDHITLGFAFEGTPPFSFKYTRSVNGAVKERRQVRNVMDPIYNITVEDGGEYEIIELEDKFCKSTRQG